jgi:hypothetical protein
VPVVIAVFLEFVRDRRECFLTHAGSVDYTIPYVLASAVLPLES